MKARAHSDRLVNYRPLLAAAIGLVCGVAFAVYCGFGGALPGGAAFVFAAAVPAAAVAGAVVSALYKRKWPLVICIFFLLGILRVQLYSPYADARLAPEGDSVTESAVCGTVISLDKTEVHAKLILGSASVNGVRARHSILLLAPLEAAEDAAVGDNINAVCSSLAVPGEHGSFNERLQRLAEGVSLRGYSADITVLSHNNAPLAQFFSNARSRIAGVIDKTFAGCAPLVKGFILGVKTDIPDETYSGYVIGGIAHVLTLSGFHVGILTGVLCFILPARKRFLRAASIALILLCYCAVTGFSPSLCRASVMCVCALSAPVFARRRDPLSSLSLSALIILAVNPFKLWSLGFLLTFAATLGILLISSAAAENASNGIKQRVGAGVMITLGASAATVLISAAAFGSVYPYNLFANIICVPMLSAAITMSFVITALAFFMPGFAALSSAAPNYVFNAVDGLLGYVSLLPYCRIPAFRPSAVSCVLALLFLFSLSQYVLRPAKTRVKIGAMILLLFTASAFADIIRP